jgi:hypothetical protein
MLGQDSRASFSHHNIGKGSYKRVPENGFFSLIERFPSTKRLNYVLVYLKLE